MRSCATVTGWAFGNELACTPLVGEHAQYSIPSVITGLLVEHRCVRPEERVSGIGVAGQFLLNMVLLQSRADLVALLGVDQGVVFADHEEEPARDSWSQIERRSWLTHRDVRSGQPPSVEHGSPADRQSTGGEIGQVTSGAKADHCSPLDAWL